MKVIAVIPARYGSTRFEGKPLVDLAGKPMIQRVYEGVCQSRLIEKVTVATDDERIQAAVHRFGGNVVMTSPDHPTGTDRIAEVARKLRADIVVNAQGDEPLIQGRVIDKAIRPLLADETLSMSTLMTKLREVKEWLNPNVAKVVVDRKGYALYFSRAPIPLLMGLNIERLLRDASEMERTVLKGVYKHIGVYVYRRKFLLQFSRMAPTHLEKLERLEQLRALECGCRIKVVPVDYEPLHVETPEDLPRVLSHLSTPP